MTLPAAPGPGRRHPGPARRYLLPARRYLGRWARLLLAALVVLYVECGLRTTRLPRLCAHLGITLSPLGAPETAPGSEPVTAHGAPRKLFTDREVRMTRATRAVLRRGPFPDTCLRRSLAAGTVLRAHLPELYIGVNKVDGRVSAHAWLVVDGVNLDPSGAANFAVLGRPRSLAT